MTPMGARQRGRCQSPAGCDEQTAPCSRCRPAGACGDAACAAGCRRSPGRARPQGAHASYAGCRVRAARGGGVPAEPRWVGCKSCKRLPEGRRPAYAVFCQSSSEPVVPHGFRSPPHIRLPHPSAGADPHTRDSRGMGPMDMCNAAFGGLSMTGTLESYRSRLQQCVRLLAAAAPAAEALRRQRKSAAVCGKCGAAEGLRKCGGQVNGVGRGRRAEQFHTTSLFLGAFITAAGWGVGEEDGRPLSCRRACYTAPWWPVHEIICPPTQLNPHPPPHTHRTVHATPTHESTVMHSKCLCMQVWAPVLLQLPVPEG